MNKLFLLLYYEKVFQRNLKKEKDENKHGNLVSKQQLLYKTDNVSHFWVLKIPWGRHTKVREEADLNFGLQP